MVFFFLAYFTLYNRLQFHFSFSSRILSRSTLHLAVNVSSDSLWTVFWPFPGIYIFDRFKEQALHSMG